MSTALKEQDTSELVLAHPSTPRARIFAEALKEETEQRELLQVYVKRHMIPDTDYGIIPGTKKNTLLKPGAEKLTELFRCTPKYDLVEKIEDWDKPLFHYVFRVVITSRDAGTALAEGYGSCNSREGRYRWRDQSRKCPTCGKETIIKGKTEYGGGWICFAKKGGCGAKFGDSAAEIINQPLGKIENPDIFDLANTILKMAKKRALVDGAIALARCSDIFTQDREDNLPYPEDIPPEPKPQRQQPAKQPAAAPPSANGSPPAKQLSEDEIVREHAKAIEDCDTLQELSGAWDAVRADKRIGIEYKTKLAKIKDERKAAMAEPHDAGKLFPAGTGDPRENIR